MIRAAHPATQSGITLAETLVALFILAIVSSAGATLLFSATSASQIVRDRESETRMQFEMAALFAKPACGLMRRKARRSHLAFCWKMCAASILVLSGEISARIFGKVSTIRHAARCQN